jgi:hypothetical protein
MVDMSSKLVIVGAFLVVLAVCASASEPYRPPGGGDDWQSVTVILQGTDLRPDASGKAVLACKMDETQHRIDLSAQGVFAAKIYSVWLVQLDAQGGLVTQLRVDNPDHPLRADGQGKISFTSSLAECPEGKYNVVAVRYHADGDPNNGAGAQTILKGSVPAT